MKHIICPLSYLPIRSEASHKSEQVSQILFGETAVVIAEENDWLQIRMDYDNYEGWLEKKTIIAISTPTNTVNTIGGFARLVRMNGESLWLSTGSDLSPALIDTTSATVVTINPELNNDSLLEIALQFIGTPYLWGGRSFMGIDCSGFVQVAFKAIGVKLPRDASQQIELGNVVQFPSDAKAGDLAFFDNEDGDITHVGLILEAGKIMHASGSVRIDKLDHQGIFNTETGNYTHKLRLIKRIIS